MQEKEWFFTDRSKWPSGPWDGEPDKKQWMDPATGLPCLIHRGPTGALCGYVGVPPGHALYKQGYSMRVPKPEGFEERVIDEKVGRLVLLCEALREADGLVSLKIVVQVHGGLTYANECGPVRENGHGICHLPEPGKPDSVWWFGFDCAHAGDVCPGYGTDFPRWDDEQYRDIAYVTNECTQLAAQLKEWKA